MTTYLTQMIVGGIALGIALGVGVFVGLVTRPWNIRHKSD